METITPSNDKLMGKQKSILDFISAGSKSDKKILKNRKNEKNEGKRDMDVSSFQNYLKETVEKKTSAKKENYNDIKAESETTGDVEYTEYDEAAINSPYDVSNYLLKNEKKTLNEINIYQNVSDKSLIQENKGKYLSDLFDKNDLDGLLQWDREELTVGSIIPVNENVNSETMEDMIKENILNKDSSIGKFPLLNEIEGDQNQASAGEKNSKAKSYLQLSQLDSLSSQNMKDEVENLANPENIQSSFEQQEELVNTSNNSKTLKQTEQSDKMKEKGGISALQNQQKGTANENYFFGDKSENTEDISNITQSELTVRKDDFRDNTTMKNNQGLYILKNSNSEEVVSNQFVSLDSKSFTLKSGDSKVISPQMLLDQIVDGGMQVIQKGSGRVKMTLNPPNLGTLDMDVQVRNNKVEVLFIADTKEIQQSLQANADLLKTALNQQGLKVDAYNVILQGNMDQGNGGYYSGESTLWHNAQRGAGKEGTRKDQAKQEDDIVDIDVKNKIGQYSISLFI